jgi:hypothetical protein
MNGSEIARAFWSPKPATLRTASNTLRGISVTTPKPLFLVFPT